MKKYIQPSLIVKEVELAPMMNTSDPTTGFSDQGPTGAGGAEANSHRGWNLWGVED